MKRLGKLWVTILLMVCLVLGAVGCGTDKDSASEAEKPALTIECDKATIASEETAQFTASISPATYEDKTVLWSIEAPAGTVISPTGLVTAGWTEGTAKITAKLKKDRNIVATKELKITKKAETGDFTYDKESPKNNSFTAASATGNITVNTLAADRAVVEYSNITSETQYHNIFATFSEQNRNYNKVCFRIKNTGAASAHYVVKIVDTNGWEYSGGAFDVESGAVENFEIEIKLAAASKGDNTVDGTKANGLIQSLIIFPDSYREVWNEGDTFNGSFLIWNVGLKKGDLGDPPLDFEPSISVVEKAGQNGTYEVEFLSNSKVALSDAAKLFAFEEGLTPATIDFTISNITGFSSSKDGENFTAYDGELFAQIVFCKSLEGAYWENAEFSTFTIIKSDGEKLTVSVPQDKGALVGYYFFVAGKDEASTEAEGKTVYKGKFDLTIKENYARAYTVTAPATVENGAVEAPSQAGEGSDLKIRFVPNEGYSFASAKINGEVKNAVTDVTADGVMNNAYIIKSVDKDVVISDVVFEEVVKEEISGITYADKAVTKAGISSNEGKAVFYSADTDLIRFSEKGTKSHLKVTVSNHTATTAGLENIQFFYDGGMTGWKYIKDETTTFYIACKDISTYLTLELVEDGTGTFDISFEYVDYIASSITFAAVEGKANEWTVHYQFVGVPGFGNFGNHLYLPFEEGKRPSSVKVTISNFEGKLFNAETAAAPQLQLVGKTGAEWYEADWNFSGYFNSEFTMEIPASATTGMALLFAGEADTVFSGSFTVTVEYTYPQQ